MQGLLELIGFESVELRIGLTSFVFRDFCDYVSFVSY